MNFTAVEIAQATRLIRLIRHQLKFEECRDFSMKYGYEIRKRA